MCLFVNKNVVACTAGLEPLKVMQAFGSGCVLACMQGVHVREMQLSELALIIRSRTLGQGHHSIDVVCIT